MQAARVEPLVLAIDIGSSSTRAALFDGRGRQLPNSRASIEYKVRYGRDGAAELSPFVLQRAVARCFGQVLDKHRASRVLRKIPIKAIGASSFWHGLIGLDRRSRPVTPI